MTPATQTAATLSGQQSTPDSLGQLDRFDLTKILGEGAQGVVYLAFDPHLERQVAIKAIGSASAQPAPGGAVTNDMQMLLREARVVSKFQHPNIVSIYEIGFIGASPYLVLEYIAGPLLSQTIKSNRSGVATNQAIELIGQILDGLAYAHDHGIIHGDLKPANVLVTETGIAKIADFGIARGIGEQSGEGLSGSPRYMAPEYISQRIMTPAADQFAAGILLYQLLTGKHPVTGKSMELIFAQITAAEFPPPSTLRAEIDPEIDAIVARALSVNPDHRFENAAAFRLALDDYQAQQQAQLTQTRTQSRTQSRPDSLHTLRQRIRGQKDFPALSSSITNLNSLFSGNQKNAQAIAAVIAKDIALTSKVMRISNSAYVPHAGGEITTLSHAVMMLGFTTVREVASSLLMIDLIKGDGKSTAVKEQLVRSLFSATLARKIAIRHGEKDVDGCYLIGMFYRFGKLLVSFHMPNEIEVVNNLVNQGIDEETAATRVLGYSYTEIGHEIAADWSLPGFLVDSIRQLDLQPAADQAPPIGIVYGALSNAVTDMLAAAGESTDLRKQLSKLRNSYQQLIDISSDELEEILDGSRVEFGKYCTILKIDTADIALINCLDNWDKFFPDQTTPAKPADGEGATEKPDQTKPGDAKATATLTRSIEEISQLLNSGEYDFDELIRKILAAIYYGAGCHRVLLCRCLEAQQTVKARYAVGKKVKTLLKQFQFPLDGTSSMFSRAVQTGKDIIVGDLATHSIQEPAPAWYNRLEPANSFALLPFQTGARVGGFIYLDHPQPHYLEQLSAEQIELLGKLRDLASQAYKARSQ